jgi:hypothetical protein
MDKIAFVPPAGSASEVFTEEASRSASTPAERFFAAPTAGQEKSNFGDAIGVRKKRARSAHQPFTDGNRLAVPREVASHHFFYKVRPMSFDQDDLDLVLGAAKKYEQLFPIPIGDIGVLRVPLLTRITPEAVRPFDRIISAMGTSDEHRERAAILVTHWAAPHVDEKYHGNAFLSYVLHTGPEPYVIQAFHTEVSKGRCPAQSLTSSTRTVETGELLMLDPTTPHLAAPARPADGQLLVLIQIIIDETDLEDRLELIKRYPPAEGDENEVL